MITKTHFDSFNGKEIYLYTLENDFLQVGVTDFGAIVQFIRLKTPKGKTDIALGFDAIADYLDSGTYCGATIGRVANRIAGGKFILDGKQYQVTQNEGGNHLHGGSGFDKKMFDVKICEDVLRLSILSVDGEDGYPGNLSFTVEYYLEGNKLEIRYSAVSDKATLWNPTNHTCFNFGDDNILNTKLQINAKYFCPIDENLIPTGELKEVTNTPFDFTVLKAIGQDIDKNDKQLQFGGGYDHNYALESEFACIATSSDEKIRMELHTDLSGLQFYSGNMLKGNGRNGILAPRQGLCLEPQYCLNSINTKNFEHCILQPATKKQHYITYRFITTQ